CCFECFALLGGLKFFPTRRSSDLGHRQGIALVGAKETGDPLGIGRSVLTALEQAQKGRGGHSVAKDQSHVLKCRSSFHYIFPFRSEEHTSELQSRENLVCRLLLE